MVKEWWHMDFTNTPRDIPPHRPTPSGGQRPMPQRRVFSDFAPRPAARPNVPRPIQPIQATPASPTHVPPVAAPAPVSRSVSHLQPPAPTRPAAPAAPTAEINPFPLRPEQERQPEPDTKSKVLKLRSNTGHAGLVGFVCFVIFTALLLSPFLPGKILDNFPGSSETESSGDQTIGCVNDLTGSASSLGYNTKLGSPIVYNYTATITQKASCNGQEKTAVEGRASQFNPLGLAADLLLALAVSVGVSWVWRKIFGGKD